MIKSDAASVLMILRAAYPQFYSGITQVDANEIMNLWYDMFADYDVNIVKHALQKLLKVHNRFPPTIADVEQQIQELISVSKNEPTNEELWQMLREGILDGRNGAVEHFNEFPEVLKKYCGSPKWLRDHADYDLNTFDTVEKAHFMKQISEMKRRVEFEAEMRGRQMINDVADPMRLIEGQA